MSSAIVFDILARDRASNTFDHVGDSASRSSGKLKKWAAAGAVAVAGGAVLATKAMIGMAQAAVEDEKGQALLAKALHNNAGATKAQVAATEDWITAQGKAYGVADDQLRPALSKLVTATHDVGKAQKLAALAMDVSAGSGKSLDAVSTALMKAQNGQIDGLSRLGIATKDAEGKTLTFEQATKKMADTFGGSAAKAADTNAGKMERLRLAYDETKESIGARLLPVLGTAADKTLAFVQQMESGEGAGGKLVSVLGGVKDNLGTIGPALGVVVGGLTAYKVASMAAAAATAIQAAGTAGATGATWSLNAALRANPIGIVVTALTALGVGLVVAYKKSETFRTVVDTAFSAVKTAGSTLWNGGIKPAFDAMEKGFDAVGKAGTWLWNKALQPAFKFIVDGVGSILDMWSDMLGVLAKVPGFGWAEKAADAMAKAADKAHAMADGIRKIPPRKDVSVVVTYKYVGLRAPGGSGPTRGRDDDFGDTNGRMAQSAASRYMDAISDGIKKGGKKLDEVLKASRSRLREQLGQIRDDMKSMSSSIASALNPTDFSAGVAELMASLTGNGSVLSALGPLFDTLKNNVSKGFLDALMNSGNGNLALALAQDPTAAAAASAQFDANAGMAKGLGDQTAQAVLGDKIAKAYADENKRLIEKLNDQPGKTAKELAKELGKLEFRVVIDGDDAGRKARLRGF